MKPDIYRQRDEFKDELYHWRLHHDLTVKELSEQADMCQSLISAYELGDKAVSSESAVKLADALELEDDNREKFFLLAAATRRRDCLVPYARTLPAEILNFVPRALSMEGIDLDRISDCAYHLKIGESEDIVSERLEITLRDGHKVLCSLSVVES